MSAARGPAEYWDLHALLTPDTLTRLVGPGAESLRRTAVTIASGSGATFVALRPRQGTEPRLLLKLLPGQDWIARATADPGCREASLWRWGILDRLPAEVLTPVVACARDGDGWAILMRDLGDVWVGDTPIAQAEHVCLLSGLAGLHATFWTDQSLDDTRLGLCSLRRYIGMFAPAASRRLSQRPDDFHALAARGWDRLGDVLDAPLAAQIRALADDPRPLSAALERLPWTLLHGDVGPGNLGLLDGEPPRCVMIDWQLALRGPAGLDLASYLMDVGPLLPESGEESVARYRGLLAQRLKTDSDLHTWQDQWELAALGAFVRMAWAYAYHVTHGTDPARRVRVAAEAAWWSELVGPALRQL